MMAAQRERRSAISKSARRSPTSITTSRIPAIPMATSAMMPIPCSTKPAIRSSLVEMDFGYDRPYGTFEAGSGDGYDLYSIHNGWVSVGGTRDGGGYSQTLWGSGCTDYTGWMFFLTSLLINLTSRAIGSTYQPIREDDRAVERRVRTPGLAGSRFGPFIHFPLRDVSHVMDQSRPKHGREPPALQSSDRYSSRGGGIVPVARVRRRLPIDADGLSGHTDIQNHCGIAL